MSSSVMEDETSRACDLLIIGAGGAGLAAAVEAASHGLRVTLLEAYEEPGGAAALSGGGCCIVDTPLQRSQGIVDSPELALADWLAWGGDQADPEWARYYLTRSAQDLYAWLETLGVRWSSLSFQEGNSVLRWHWPEGGGHAVAAVLLDAARRLQARLIHSARATALIQRDGAVVGVRAEIRGAQVDLHAPSVLVATGGFVNNRTMLLRHFRNLPDDARLLSGGAPQAMGGGHGLLAGVGARFANMETVWTYPVGTPNLRDPDGQRGLVVRGLVNEIWVNKGGDRFHDENRRGARIATPALLRQSGATSWGITDQAEIRNIRLLCDAHFGPHGDDREPVAEFLAHSPYVHTATTMEGLAEAAHLPPAHLAATLQRYNAWVERGLDHDPDFGRYLRGARPIAQPPYSALQYFPIAQKNFGGVCTDLACRVLRDDGRPIPGVLAAGEVAGMAGGHINGAAGLEGTMLGPSLFSGRVAAWTAMEMAHAVEVVPAHRAKTGP